jgi:hypothetical protein
MSPELRVVTIGDLSLYAMGGETVDYMHEGEIFVLLQKGGAGGEHSKILSPRLGLGWMRTHSLVSWTKRVEG